MNSIITATQEYFPIIQNIAKEAWPVAFGNILSQKQINYMMEMMYSSDSLINQTHNLSHTFILSCLDSGSTLEYTGYASYELNHNNQRNLKLHKLYLLPNFKGRGIGKLLISHIEVVAKQNNMDFVILNVNRYNPSVGFYLNNGYSIMDSVDIDIGEGFLMEDYIMGKSISY